MPAAMATSYSRRKARSSPELTLKLRLKLSRVLRQRPCAVASEGLSIVEKTVAPTSRYSTMRRASSRKRPLSWFSGSKQQHCLDLLKDIIQSSAPAVWGTADSSAPGGVALEDRAGHWLPFKMRAPALQALLPGCKECSARTVHATEGSAPRAPPWCAPAVYPGEGRLPHVCFRRPTCPRTALRERLPGPSRRQGWPLSAHAQLVQSLSRHLRLAPC
ncbi:hypothetical protein NDU88_009727 [Pleurodeles waltl]|uniref:Uncharacterized protein n=1 Tax=Pleurodeles waltl TaxID=8319 RepID=A0AAV7RW16_PLEWA|nr:hypothetical protein NDU88_009727 [Pleurodeles waltl]